MKTTRQRPGATTGLPEAHSELLILPDGRIFVHNLTPTMAALLHELNPHEDSIRPRAGVGAKSQTPSQFVA